MKVKCVICDRIESIPDDLFEAKRLRNRPIHTFMCDKCEERIREKTYARMATGNFKLYRSNNKKENW